MTVADLKPVLIYKNEVGYEVGDISNDRKFIAFGKSGDSTADSDVYLYNVATKEMKTITKHEGEVENNPQEFDVDSKALYFLSNEGDEFSYLARYDLASGKREVVEKAKWDIAGMGFSRTGKYRVIGDERGRADEDRDHGNSDGESGGVAETTRWRRDRGEDFRERDVDGVLPQRRALA